ncbi:ABC transporter permease [Paraburkholderia domus]|uniref:ABC transporter permease n=1 Tax=Paraburkholderia domus TaxID=2793075 RepID=UPI001B0CBEDC|nr:ABC transporter permease [Paraburkholderia domus]CAE6828952.1 Putative aliphatic sulfonates transport permease protein SsuC [Paraburkholderia domus]CAE6922141.1 Putative aliphatic sulfonates transport permease protein SsuC [Paraburkholderia domus]
MSAILESSESASIRRISAIQQIWNSVRLARVLARFASVLACVGIWQVLAEHHMSFGFMTFANVPAPSDVVPAAWALLHSPKLPMHLLSSVMRVLAGFVAASVVGIGLGLAIGRYRVLEVAVLPPLEVLRPIPAVAWIPLAILMFPSSEMSMMFITFIGALFPILLNTIHGVEGVDPRLVATARSLGTRGGALFSEVILPGAAPAIVTGLSIGMGTAWFCLVTAEMIAGQYGIGYFTWESYTLQNYADIVVGMLLIGAMGMGSSLLVRRVGLALIPWYRMEASQQ